MINAIELTDATFARYAERATSLGERLVLRDGTVAWVGPLLPTDRDDLACEFETLSEEAKRQRFLAGVAHLNSSLLDLLVDGVDGVEHVALVVFVEQDERVLPAAIGRIVRHAQAPDAADIAVTVKDAFQGRGLATALLPLLIERRPPGVRRLLTEVLEDNLPSLAMLQRLGPARIHYGGPGGARPGSRLRRGRPRPGAPRAGPAAPRPGGSRPRRAARA